MARRVRVRVAGRVQGVFYRTSCASRARELGLGGSVRNLPDGRVEAVFEGPDAAVDQMVTWCRIGPELAVVDAVEVVSQEPIGEVTFRIAG